MKKEFFLLLCSACIFTFTVNAQYRCNYSLRVDKGFDSLQYAMVGGLNNPQFSAIDLNNDGILDLFVFDRTENKVLTFINHGDPGKSDYAYAPEYQKYFPPLTNWALLVDFNCDGIPDIFTSTTLGIEVYKGYYVDNHIAFSLYSPLLYFEYVGDSGKIYRLNIPVTSVDIPAILDVNKDGDIDIITKDIAGGNYDQYYENQSQEDHHGCDSLFYKLVDPCWGRFYESLGSDKKFLDQPCLFQEAQIVHHGDSAYIPVPNGITRHSGSTTLVFDNNGDGRDDAFQGNIQFNNIVYLVNSDTASSADAFFVSQDTTFPSYNVPAVVITFPASFRLDLDNDGVKDLIFAPNYPQGSNFNACSWFYKNLGNDSVGNFSYQTDSFLVNQMVDVGSGARPVFYDYNNDGLMDIVMGNDGYYNGYSQLALYQNTGTATHPQFKFITNDYCNLSALHLLGIRPTFGDLYNTGSKDMVIGSENGRLYYFKNESGTFVLQDTEYFKIFLGTGSFPAPQLVDVDGDGLLDLLVGTYGGRIQYYHNNGTASEPLFSNIATSDTFGGINTNISTPLVYSQPCLTHLPGYTGNVLLVGNAGGQLQLYNNIDNNLTGDFNLVTNNYCNISTGNTGYALCSIDAADINSDGVVELLVGLYGGGFHVYDTSSVDLDDFPSGVSNIVSNTNIILYPNPTGNQLNIHTDNNNMKGAQWKLTVNNILGQQVINRNAYFNTGTESIDVSLLPAGLYIVEVYNNKAKFERKFVKE